MCVLWLCPEGTSRLLLQNTVLLSCGKVGYLEKRLLLIQKLNVQSNKSKLSKNAIFSKDLGYYG